VQSSVKGLTSPMKVIKDCIMEVELQLTKICVPITHRQGLELANSLIGGTLTAEKV